MRITVNIIIINSQNVQTEHLLAAIIASVFKEESTVFVCTYTELQKLPLDDLESLRHHLAELHVIQVIAWNISVCSFL